MNPRHSKDRDSEAEETKEFKLALSLADLMGREFPEPQWVVEKIFESGTINMISARPNHYKSWVVLEIALTAAKGEKLFGIFQTSRQLVMIVNEEDGVRMIQQRMNLIDPKLTNLPIYFHVQQDLKLTEHNVAKLIDEAKMKGITMIIFDSLRSVHSGDENSSQEMQEVMDYLKKFTRNGLTVLFTHHNRKKPAMGVAAKEDGEETRGSSGINAAVHGHISLVAHVENGEKFLVVRQQKLKGEQKIDPFELVITPIPWGFTYRKHDEREQDQSGISDLVLYALEAEDIWLSVDDLIAESVGGHSSVRFALRNLVSFKKVEVKSRKEVIALGFRTRSDKGAPNQNLYHFLSQEDSEGDPVAD